MNVDQYHALAASRQTEHQLQLEVTRWLAANLGPNAAWSSVDHAAKLTVRQAGERKRRGVRRGLADYVFVGPGGRHCEIELKRPVASSRQSAEQKAWQARVEAGGGLYAVCRSLPEVVGVLRRWGVLGAGASA